MDRESLVWWGAVAVVVLVVGGAVVATWLDRDACGARGGQMYSRTSWDQGRSTVTSLCLGSDGKILE